MCSSETVSYTSKERFEKTESNGEIETRGIDSREQAESVARTHTVIEVYIE
jgi:hypothetical protein